MKPVQYIENCNPLVHFYKYYVIMIENILVGGPNFQRSYLKS